MCRKSIQTAIILVLAFTASVSFAESSFLAEETTLENKIVCSHPDRFAAIAPICGGGETIKVLLAGRKKGQDLRSMGIWAFHGAKDSVVPLSESERMVRSLKKMGCQDVKLTVYPEANHDSWTTTYDNPELYDWFLKHSR